MANFNFSGNSEYNLNTSMIDEVINLYGVPIKFLITQKINRDDLVFGDFSHLKTDNNKIYDLYAMPENSDDWDQGDSSFGQFGLTNFENINLFVSKKNIIDTVPDLANNTGTLTGNLIVLPNQKIMEITNAMWEVPGVNNLFTYNDGKSVIKITCKPYDHKIVDEINPTDISLDPNVPYQTLDVYFNELINQTAQQDAVAEIIPSVPVVQKGVGGIDTVSIQPPVDKNTEPDIWGQFK